jgi:hypothetical protein
MLYPGSRESDDKENFFSAGTQIQDLHKAIYLIHYFYDFRYTKYNIETSKMLLDTGCGASAQY